MAHPGRPGEWRVIVTLPTLDKQPALTLIRIRAAGRGANDRVAVLPALLGARHARKGELLGRG